jgi:hypothetical protein
MVSWCMEFENKKELRDQLAKISDNISKEKESMISFRLTKDRVLILCSRKYDYRFFGYLLLMVLIVAFYFHIYILAWITGFFFVLTSYVHTGHFNFTVFRWAVERSGYKGKSWYHGEAIGFRRLLQWGKI